MDVVKARDKRKAKPSQGEWSSLYFGPTTLLLAATVLIGSIQVGKYAGTQIIGRGDPQYGAPTVHVAPAPALHRSGTKATVSSPAKTKALPIGKAGQAAPAVQTTVKH
jgi:hypothetical protein